ncbi:PTS system trehalose-specific EIIBC component [Oceanobacillus caeni]|uniref:PTS system trehalose-specific EIIBC component n=1 Tax=Oceanobacillus caeni TaxID=405946 RepID=UPI00363A8A91
MNNKEWIYAPLSGKVQKLENVPDPTISNKLMGEGIAIEPSEGKVVSPFDGEVLLVAETKHAIGLKSKSGVEILIHIGLETVALNGEGFDLKVNQGDQVKKGDSLISFDLELIKEKASSTITPVIITNGNEFELDHTTAKSSAILGETKLFQVSQVGQEKKAEKKTKDSSVPYGKEAKEIVAAIGGEENVDMATHCVTRLRFALNDEKKVDLDALESIDIVKGSFSTNGQFQVIIGQGTVDKVYKAMVQETGISEASKDEVKQAGAEKHQNILQRGIKILADIFIPILPAIVMAGLLMGINNVLVNPIFTEQSIIEMYPQWAGIADMINIIANTAFTFLPALIGWSAVKRFGGSELLGIVLGLILVHPDLMNAWGYGAAAAEGDIPSWNLFGLEIEKVGYQGQVLPVLVASWVLAKIEVFLRKRVIDSLHLLVVAPLALLITGILAFILIGPITFTIGSWITTAVVSVFDMAPVVGGLLYGALYAPLVITGMHHTFLAVDLQLIGTIGGTFLWPILALSNIAQGSSVFGIMLATKDEKLKGLAGTSGLSAWLGVTEPAMFGVNLRYRYPFYAAVIGTAIAGAFISFGKVKASSVGIGGIPAPLSIFPESWISFLIGMVIVIVVPFLITFIIAKRKLR